MTEAGRDAPGTSLETVILFTARMEELAAFYEQGLGLGTFQRARRHMGQQVGPVYLGFDQVDDAGTGDRLGTGRGCLLFDSRAQLRVHLSLLLIRGWNATDSKWNLIDDAGVGDKH